jgi:Ca-activated chloride channel family protein
VSSLKVDVALSHTYLPSDYDMDEPLYALLNLTPESGGESTTRAALNMVFVIDASASMHDLQLTSEQREHWRALAKSRGDLHYGQADGRDVVYYTGDTLAEMQAVCRKPMAIVVDAIKEVLGSLQHDDRISVIAFADRVHSVFTEEYWQSNPDQCGVQLDALRDRRLPTDIGTGTYMADALRTAAGYLERGRTPMSVNRIIVLSDGVVQDARATMENVSAIERRGYPVSTIGVGRDFDDAYMIRIADTTRGAYYYAADKSEIVDRIHEELKSLQTTAVTDLYVAVRGMEGTVVQEIYQVKPSMNIFDEIYTEDDWLRARLGDVSSADPAAVLVQLAPPMHDSGENLIANVLLTWTNPTSGLGASQGNAKVSLSAGYGSEEARLAARTAVVEDMVNRFQIFKLERDAQRAQERGDMRTVREKLGAATRELKKMGETALARDYESQLNSLDAGQQDSVRIKRLRATTRKLANSASGGSDDSASE